MATIYLLVATKLRRTHRDKGIAQVLNVVELSGPGAFGRRNIFAEQTFFNNLRDNGTGRLKRYLGIKGAQDDNRGIVCLYFHAAIEFAGILSIRLSYLTAMPTSALSDTRRFVK